MSIINQTSKSIYSGYDVSATAFVYTTTGAAGINDGWTESKYTNKAVQIGLATLTDSKLYYQVEGRSGQGTRPCLLYNASLTSQTTLDSLIEISEPVSEIRVGVRTDAVATPNNVYISLIQYEEI